MIDSLMTHLVGLVGLLLLIIVILLKKPCKKTPVSSTDSCTAMITNTKKGPKNHMHLVYYSLIAASLVCLSAYVLLMMGKM